MSLVEIAGQVSPLTPDRQPSPAWNIGEGDAASLTPSEAARVRHVIEHAIGEAFGVTRAELAMASRGRARIAHARQAAMYLAHVSCGLTLTDVGMIFARDRTTVAHACGAVEDRRDDHVFDRALELLEWIVPTLVGQGRLHRDLDH
jgi:hypothetical protein